MAKKQQATGTVDAARWLEDQMQEIKAHVARLEQQVQQVQALGSAMSDSLRDVEASLRKLTVDAAPVPGLREELNQTVALIVQLQDRYAEATTRLDTLERGRDQDNTRENEEWNGIAGRLEALERRAEAWATHGASVSEVPGRLQDSVALLQQLAEKLQSRVETVEDRAARGLDGANRAEHNLSLTQAELLAVQRQQEALAEGLRKSAAAAGHAEERIKDHFRDLERLQLLSERIELHRAERQRLEDRAMKLEQELTELRTESDRREERYARMEAKQGNIATKLETVEAMLEEERGLLVDQMRKLTSAQERTKRRQMQETERELREMKRYVADLADR